MYGDPIEFQLSLGKNGLLHSLMITQGFVGCIQSFKRRKRKTRRFCVRETRRKPRVVEA